MVNHKYFENNFKHFPKNERYNNTMVTMATDISQNVCIPKKKHTHGMECNRVPMCLVISKKNNMEYYSAKKCFNYNYK